MPMSPRLLRPRAASGFTPLSLPSLAVWLDANDTSTLFQDSAQTTQATAGGPVGAWKSKGLGGGAFTQSTDSLRPTRTDNYQGGKPAVVSDGSDDWLRAAASSVGISSATAATGFFVTRKVSGGSNAAWDFGTSVSNPISAGNTSLFDDFFRTSRISGSTGQDISVTSITDTGASGARTGWKVNGTNVTFTSAGVFLVPTTAYVGGGPAFPSGFLSFGGGVCEVLIYTRALSATETSTVERYLGRKWGISIA